MPINFQKLEPVRIALALVAAVITGGAALYGVYHNAREATAAGYETLAPEINDLKQAVTRLQQENEELRQAMANQSGPAVDRAPPSAGRSTARRTRTAREPAPRDAPAPATLPPESSSPPATGTPPATPPADSPPPAEPKRPGGVQGEVERRVPIDFEKAREIWKEVRKLPRPGR